MSVAWPAGFLWGSAAAATQCEGASIASDWLAWERAGRAPVSGAGNGFFERYAEDFALLASLGLRHHRLTVDWARIEPTEGSFDPSAIDHYRRVLGAAREAGIEPWVCLHHFSSPAWFTAAGGFPSPACRLGAWARFVELCASRFGDLVTGWKPINESVGYCAAGYLAGVNPPGVQDLNVFLDALEGVLLGGAEAALVLRSTGKPVSTIHNLGTIHPVGAGAEFTEEVFDAALWRSWIGLERDGVLAVPGREPAEYPHLAGAFDYIGFTYYAAMGVTANILAPVVPYPEGWPISPLGYAIWPDGFRLVLDRLHEELPGRPLLVCEYGIGTADDTERVAYLERMLEIAREAIAGGVQLAGMFHWTGVDNYEWLHGYDVAFGVIDAERRVKPSAQVLKAAAPDDQAV